MKFLQTVLFLSVGLCASAQDKSPNTVTLDAQEWREKPFRHFYIHGIWNGDTAFQVLLPDPVVWKGRMMHFLEGSLGGSENFGVALGEHAYALANGAAYVESSQGHLGPQIDRPGDTAREIAYEASYAVVQYAKARCVQFYGREPDFTYVFGMSGGGVRSSGLLERFPKVYDGAVPVVGASQLKMIWYLHSLYEAYRPAIQARIPMLSDRVRPGAMQDLYEGLSTTEKTALQAILSAGYPRNAIPEIRPYPVGLLMMDFVKYKSDTAYFEDFWKLAGYAGADGECRTEVVEGIEGKVNAVDSKRYVLVADRERAEGELFGHTLTFTSGAETGGWRTVAGNKGAVIVLMASGPLMDKVKPGDRYRIDNRDLVAWRRYYRHIAEPNEPIMAGLFRQGKPRYPQRPRAALADLEDAGRPVGKFKGKMIAVFAGDDPLMWPSVAVRYRRQVLEALGGDLERRFRLHFVEHGIHGMPANAGREVFWGAAVQKAMDDLMLWVEKGTPAPPGTVFTETAEHQIALPPTAAGRRGYQPLVEITAQGRAQRVEVPAGITVAFRVAGSDPDNDIVRLEMDFDGDNKFDEEKKVGGRTAAAIFQHVYRVPGTYFAAVRVTDSTTSLGGGDPGIQNVASIRVIVK